MKPYNECQSSSRNGTGTETHLGSRLGNGTKVVDHVSFGHADTGIPEAEELILLVGADSDVKFLFSLESGGVSQGRVADFVESIGTVGNQFPKEDFLVGVEGIYGRQE
jgi:hypothetical protein